MPGTATRVAEASQDQALLQSLLFRLEKASEENEPACNTSGFGAERASVG